MAEQLISIAPPVHVTIRDVAGGSAPALLLALCRDDESGETQLFVATRHHGASWVERDAVLEAWKD